MRIFIVFCLAVAVCADKLGYNYHPVPHSNNGLSFHPGGAPQRGEQELSPVIELSQGHGHSHGHSSSQASGHHHSNHLSSVEEYQKEFYSYSAPEEDLSDADDSQRAVNSVRKNLRVVFIRAPEDRGIANAALALAKHASDDRTAIYVLQKQADVSNLAQQIQGARSENSKKPEVHFVKYRTEQDALNAQKAIQSQYNELPGSSSDVNGGVAPVLNFASRIPLKPGPVLPGPDAEYLPAHAISFKRRF